MKSHGVRERIFRFEKTSAGASFFSNLNILSRSMGFHFEIARGAKGSFAKIPTSKREESLQMTLLYQVLFHSNQMRLSAEFDLFQN